MTADSLPGIVALCAAGTVPVGVNMGLAIKAHQQSPDPFTLRAVILAYTPEIVDQQRQLDYLTALPEAAWDANAGWSASEVRDETLTAISRSIAWRSVCV